MSLYTFMLTCVSGGFEGEVTTMPFHACFVCINKSDNNIKDR